MLCIVSNKVLQSVIHYETVILSQILNVNFNLWPKILIDNSFQLIKDKSKHQVPDILHFQSEKYKLLIKGNERCFEWQRYLLTSYWSSAIYCDIRSHILHKIFIRLCSSLGCFKYSEFTVFPSSTTNIY